MLLVLAIALVNVALAYFFHGTGEVQFMGLLVALTLLAGYHGIRLNRMLRHKTIGLPKRVLTVVSAWLFICLSWFAVAFTASYASQDAKIIVPWLSVILYATVFFLPQIKQRHTSSLSKLAVQLVAVFYTVIILLFACIAYASPELSKGGAMIIVIALQLQFIMNYVLTETNYIFMLQKRARLIAEKLRSTDEVSVGNITLMIGALPFFMPLFIIAMLM